MSGYYVCLRHVGFLRLDHLLILDYVPIIPSPDGEINNNLPQNQQVNPIPPLLVIPRLPPGYPQVNPPIVYKPSKPLSPTSVHPSSSILSI